MWDIFILVKYVTQSKSMMYCDPDETYHDIAKLSRQSFIALCSYPHVKVSIKDLNQIFNTAPIF